MAYRQYRIFASADRPAWKDIRVRTEDTSQFNEFEAVEGLDSEGTDIIRPDSIKSADRQATDDADMDALDAIADSGPD